MRNLRVLFIPTASSGIQYWRIQNFVEAAWRTGVASFQNPLWVKDWHQIMPWQEKMSSGPTYDPIFPHAFVPMIESGCRDADAVVFQSLHTTGAMELFEAIRLKFPDLPILTEIDDNILSVPVCNEAVDTYDPRSSVRAMAVEQMRQSDGIIVSTPYLRELYSEYNDNVFVVPNCIDWRIWDSLQRRRRSGIRIGWAGGSGHEADVVPFAQAIKRITERHREVRFVFINGPAQTGLPEELKGIRGVEHKMKWVPILRYPKMMAGMGFDIGIAPLIDSAFNRAKSNLKWLENSALGIPTVASNVGHMAETIEHGIDGMLVDDPDGFEEALEALIRDKRLRSRIGMTSNRRARESFDVEKIVQRYVSCLEAAIEIKREGGGSSVEVTPPDAPSAMVNPA